MHKHLPLFTPSLILYMLKGDTTTLTKNIYILDMLYVNFEYHIVN